MVRLSLLINLLLELCIEFEVIRKKLTKKSAFFHFKLVAICPTAIIKRKIIYHLL
jgi:hypothetical protein